MKTFKLSLFLFLALCVTALFIAPNCAPPPDDEVPEDPEPSAGTTPEEQIKTVSEEGGYTFTYDKSTAGKLFLRWDNGDVYECPLSNGKVSSIELSTGGKVSCSYDNDGNLTRFEQDYGGYKVANECKYANGYISEIKGITSLKQPDGTFKDETNFICDNFVVDANGISSCDYETFVGGNSLQDLDITVTCSSQDNNLYQSSTHCSLIEFTDYFNNMFYYSPKCIESIDVTDPNNNNTYTIEYDCLTNSWGGITQLDITHPSLSTKRTYTYD